ncbi:MAG: ribosomal RNA small subunit methyltransferase A [Parcubacteria group bacterium]|nr:ribosomal RNA small subunit methyltransferase A [Parcubacteria group bacterium]|tara:strand:- start:827 stop:1600 length:774 start_codon:yes stop_codon:yes gene_type:complete
MKAKKHLGQHFLTSKPVLKDMLTAAQITKDDTVLEIGPGKGMLTRALLQEGATVIAIETDAAMIAILGDAFDDYIRNGKLTIIHEDVLGLTLRKYIATDYKIVANIPYYITGEIIRLFLSADHPPLSMTLLVQKEVAHRIARDTKESILSISVKVFGAPRYVGTVAARYFNPAPKVDSAIVHIDTISKQFFENVSEEHFFKVVKNGFSNKRKKLANNLAPFGSREKILSVLHDLGFDENARAEEIHVDQWKELALLL